MVCFADLEDSRGQYIAGGDDPWEIGLLRRWLRAGDIFIDAGANIGLYAQAVADHASGRVSVLAIDASPRLVQRLAEAAAMLGRRNLTAAQAVLGDRSDEVVFYLARSGKTTVSQSLHVDAAEVSDYEPTRLPARTLGDLAAAHMPGRTPAAVKLDVEGAEPLALRGAPLAWLSSEGPLWLVEIHGAALERSGFRPDDVLRSFPVDSFERWILPKYPFDNGTTPQPRPLTPAENYDDARFFNLVAVPVGAGNRSRRDRVRALLGSADAVDALK